MHDKQLKFNVASQSGKVITEYKLVIIGDQSALDVKEITVNGNKAEAPTASDPDYRYYAIVPDAVNAAVKAVATRANARVIVNGGEQGIGSGSAVIDMPIGTDEKAVDISMYNAATPAGAAADLTVKLQLKRLSADYRADIIVDGTAAH